MTSIVNFGDFLRATRDVKYTSPETLIIEASKNTYFISRALKGQPLSDTFKGGSKLVEKILAGTNNNFSFYAPNATFSPSSTDTLKEIEVNWAFAQAHFVWTDETTTLNAGDPIKFIDLKKAYEAGALVDTLNGMERSVWAAPNYDKMESVAASPREAYSILSFVTRDGLVPAVGNGGIATGSSAWSTLQTLSPSAAGNEWYRNAYKSYTASKPSDIDTGIIPGLDDLTMQVRFEMPTALRKYSENEKLQKQTIVTNRQGVTKYKAALRANNDRMDMLKDPAISGPQFQGIPVEYVSELDNAGWTDNQPDYLLLNFDYLRMFIHSDWFLKSKSTDGGSTQPNSHVEYYFSWFNWICRSRRRQGRLFAA